ncbi:trans-aconitate 2-methyltransferase [Novosphingobium sp.]|uniref:class I SAM-dependent methyltransferase n=1 Tax=Novosphingobium sp. TaxID=1874826 RepID=UPI0035B09EC2
MTTRTDWQAQVGRTWAENYHLTDRSFSGLTQRLLERIRDCAGKAVLDVGCGAGELTLAVARARPHARVIGVDVSAELVAAARGRGDLLGNASFVEADAASWREPGFAPDLLISRHGVMFFDDPVAAFANLYDQAAPGAQLLFSCFRSPLENPWASDLAQLLRLPPAADPRAPGPFAFADPAHVEAILEGAGWQAVACDPVDFAYVASTGNDPVAEALDFFKRIGPAAAMLRSLEGEELAEAVARITNWLEEHRSGNLIAFGAAAWLVSARKG